MRLPRLAAATAAVVLTLGLVGACSGDDGDGPSGGGDDTKNSGSSTGSGSLTKENFAQTIGDAMVESGSTHVELKSSGSFAISAEGDQRIGRSSADSEANLTMSFSGQTFELVQLDRKVYFNMGALTKNKFAEIDLTDTSDPVVQQFGPLARQTDLAQQFKVFGEAVTGFEQKGDTKKIDGVETTPYLVTVDAKKVLEASGQSGASTAGMPESFEYVFFVGEDNLVRRLTVDVMGQGVSMDFTDWGKDVKVSKPPADQITDQDLSELFGSNTVPN